MQSQKWLTDFKLSLINHNLENLENLSNSMPPFDNLQDSTEALALIEQASTLFQNKKSDILNQMENIKKSKKFLE